jgi:hypothetical protein
MAPSEPMSAATASPQFWAAADCLLIAFVDERVKAFILQLGVMAKRAQIPSIGLSFHDAC